MSQKPLLIFCITLLLSIPLASCGNAVLAGGAVSWKNQEIYDEFINQATLEDGTIYIGIITAGISLSIAKSTATDIANQLRLKYGVQNAEWLPFHPDSGTTCKSDQWNDKLNQMTGLYFNGGDVFPIVSCFLNSPALSIIQSRYASGDLAIFGSSAGSMAMQSTPVRSMRESWSALVYGSTYAARAGLGLFNAGIMDVHFSTRGRLGALARFVYDYQSSSTIGFGVDQDTAFVTTDDDLFEVVGTSGVSIIDVSEASKYSPDGNGKRWAIRNVKVSYLTDGDSYYASSGEIVFADDKSELEGSDSVTPRTTSNVFGDGAFISVARSLFSSSETETSGTTMESKPRYEIDFRKEDDSVGYSSGSLISFRNLYVDIYCVLNC